MKHIYKFSLLVYMLFTGISVQAQYAFTTANLGPYKQDFAGMTTGTSVFNKVYVNGVVQPYSDGTNPALSGIIAGYATSATTFGGVPPSVTANNGLNSTTAAYNFGTTGAADRALGGIAGGISGNSGTGYIAVRLRNKSKQTIKNLDIRYALEQWFNSSIDTDAYFRASYRTYADTTSFTNNDLVQANSSTGTTGWLAVPELDLLAPATAGVRGQVDGNSTTYRRTAQHKLTGINLGNNTEVIIRFVYAFSSTTNGNGISLDDIVIYPETNVLYSTPTGKLDATTSWGLNSDGTNPPDAAVVNFANPNCTYYVQGNTGASRITSGGSWSVTGKNSRIVVGTDASPATLDLAAGDNLTDTLDVARGSTLRIANLLSGSSIALASSPLTLGNLASNSTVHYISGTSGNSQAVLPATYANLSFSGNSPKDLIGTVTVAQSLTLMGVAGGTTQGVRLNNYNLTLQRGATLSCTNGQLVISGTGEYRATVIGAGANSVPVLFPVAISSSAANYLPVTITAGINSAGNDKDETYRVRVIDRVYNTYSAAGVGSSQMTVTNNVTNTWLISHETATPVSAKLNLGWVATSRQGSGFTPAAAYIDHYTTVTTNSWDQVGPVVGATVGTTLSTVERANVTKFSPFMVTSATPLPVKLVSFTAKRTTGGVACTWATASERNNDHFIVERSLDGETFQPLGTVAGQRFSAATRTYSFVDTQPVATMAYYRLQQVDVDGATSFSPVVTVEGVGIPFAASITVVPNPSTGLFELCTFFDATTQVQGVVLNTLGQQVLTISEQLPAGAATFHLNLSTQPTGVYIVQLRSPSGSVTLRLLKQ
jgi:hypothetical protein